MKTLVFIGLLGIFSYHCSAISREFKGSSIKVKTCIGLLGAVNYIMFIIMTIICFWPFKWWQPIVMFFASTVLGGLTAFIFQKTLVGMVLSSILVEVFFFISCFSLCRLLF